MPGPPIVADQMKPLASESISHGQDIPTEVREGVASRSGRSRLRGIAALIRRDHAIASLPEGSNLLHPLRRGGRETVQKNHQFTGLGARDPGARGGLPPGALAVHPRHRAATAAPLPALTNGILRLAVAAVEAVKAATTTRGSRRPASLW
mgnify:CR=1 FL=1